MTPDIWGYISYISKSRTPKKTMICGEWRTIFPIHMTFFFRDMSIHGSVNPTSDAGVVAVDGPPMVAGETVQIWACFWAILP